MNFETLQIWEERKLMNRILVASRSVSETDVPKIFCTFEFSVVPLSIFAPNGSLLYAKEKSVIATQLKEFQEEDTAIGDWEETNIRKGLIIGVKIDIKAVAIESCASFATNFSQKINWHASKFDKVRVIFDLYDVKPLKGNTRASRSKRFVPVHYEVIGTTRNGYLEAKYILAWV